MTTEQQVLLPDIGDVSGVEVIELLVKPGDVISAETPLLTLESDKASMEIPSPYAGAVANLNVALGDTISEGALIATIMVDDAAASGSNDEAATKEQETVAAVAEAPATTTEQQVLLPDIGDVSGVTVIELLVKPGDDVAVETPLLTLESDKASMEIPTPYAGKVVRINVALGDSVEQGMVIATMLSSETASTEADKEKAAESTPPPTAAKPTAAVQPVSAKETSQPSAATGSIPHASPAIRRFARELGVNLTLVSGSGRKGRIVRDDVQGFVKQSLQQAQSGPSSAFAMAPVPEIDFSQFGEIATQPLSRIQKRSGANLHRNWVTIPHITQHDEAEITELESFRQLLNAERRPPQTVKLTLLPLLIKALVSTLKAYPTFNASLSSNGEELILKHYYHIGIAVDTPEGLVVPVIRDADQKSVWEITNELAELSEKARARKLKPAEMMGGTFTITSLGGIGGTAFTPIINAPEVAILGVARSQMKPIWSGEAFEPKLMLPLSLSYDHRVIDGAAGARFIVALGQRLTDLRRVLL